MADIGNGQSLTSEGSSQPVGMSLVVGGRTIFFNDRLSAGDTDPQGDARFDAMVNRLKSYLQDVYAKYGLPIWITEFSANKNRVARAQVEFMRRAMPMLEGLDFVERYSYMRPNVVVAGQAYGSYGRFFEADGSLTAVGEVFRAAPSGRAVRGANYQSSGSLDL